MSRRLGRSVLVLIAAGSTVGCSTPMAREVRTLAGSKQAGYQDGPASEARFDHPRGVAADSAGNVYVADTGNNRIRKIWREGAVTTIAGSGVGKSGGDADGQGILAEIWAPSAIVLSASGDLYVADGRHHIREIAPNGLVTTLAFQQGRFDVRAMAIDQENNLFVADGAVIRRITRTGEMRVLGKAGNMGEPAGMAPDSRGGVYVADVQKQQVLHLAGDGSPGSIVGSGICGLADGGSMAAQFNEPTGLVLTPDGTLFVGDTYNHRIRRISTNGRVSTYAGTGGTGLFDGGGFVDGSGAAAGFSEPRGLSTNSGGAIYVADSRNNCIRIVK